MDLAEFDRVAATFHEFYWRFAPHFGYPQAQRRGAQYLRGLLVQDAERRNAENLAEAIEGGGARAFQRFLTESPWDSARVIDELHAAIVDGRPPLHNGRWALATLEICLAMLQSSRQRRDIMLEYQVGVP